MPQIGTKRTPGYLGLNSWRSQLEKSRKVDVILRLEGITSFLFVLSQTKKTKVNRK